MKVVAVLALACALFIPAAGAGAATGGGGSAVVAGTPPISWGVADDASKYADDGGSWFYGELQGAGLTQNRWTVAFDPSEPDRDQRAPVPRARRAEGSGRRRAHPALALLAEGLRARPDRVLRLGAEGRADRQPVGHPRLHRLERAEHAALLVAAEGCERQGRRRRRSTRRCSRSATTRSTRPIRPRT